MPARVVFLVGGFPHVSETFIWREAISFQDSGAATLMALEENLYRPEMFPSSVGRVVAAMDFRRFSVGQTLLVLCQAIRNPVAVVAAWRLMAPFYGPRRRLSLIYSLMRLRRIMARDGCNRVHAHWRSPTDVAYLNHRIFGDPFSIFLHAHDIYDDGLGEARYRPLFQAKIEAAEFVFTCTEKNRRTLSELFPAGNIVRVYHGVDDLLVTMPRRRDTFAGPLRLISVGRIIAYKGFDLVPEMASRLVELGVDFRWTIVGDGSLYESLREELSNRRLGDRVTLLGMLSNDEVIERLLDSDVFVFLGNQAKGQYGLPNVLIEAAACGLCVVTKYLDTVEELIRDGENGFVTDDLELMAERIAALARDRQTLADMGSRARDGVARVHLHAPNTAAMFALLGMTAFVGAANAAATTVAAR